VIVHPFIHSNLLSFGAKYIHKLGYCVLRDFSDNLITNAILPLPTPILNAKGANKKKIEMHLFLPKEPVFWYIHRLCRKHVRRSNLISERSAREASVDYCTSS
jgi:hypothetical protein